MIWLSRASLDVLVLFRLPGNDGRLRVCKAVA